MANITEEHLHHMARRHHATMKKLDGLREKFGGITQRTVGTLEMGAGAWIGGAIEGRTTGAALGPIPVNLGVGIILLAAGHLDLAKEWSGHLNNFGNGFIGSYLAATGYAFGKRWKETGKVFGDFAGRPWTHPYENGWPKSPAEAGLGAAARFARDQPKMGWDAVHGDLSEAQMAAIVQRMQEAAGAPAQP